MGDYFKGKFKLLRSEFRDDGVCVVTMNHKHPACVLTVQLYLELSQLVIEIDKDPNIRVFILKSADPDFFIAHFDVEILAMQVTQGNVPAQSSPSKGLSGFHVMCERVKNMDKITIAEVSGRIGGGGCEFASNFDMRFGLDGKTVINQMEVPLGILPGGTGTVVWPKLTNRSRALEVIVGGVDVDSKTAVQWGWLNRSFESQKRLGDYVSFLGHRIASFPKKAVVNAKRSIMIDLEDTKTNEKKLYEESRLFAELMNTQEALSAMKLFLKRGGQTREGELIVSELMTADKSKL
jgi:enoyl-CoA hydratase/carnithine racemase